MSYYYYTAPSLQYQRVFEEIIGQDASLAHCLIGGASGSGKSVFVNGLIYAITSHYTPANANLWLIDPKHTELFSWQELPHTKRYAESPKEISTLMADAVNEMTRRLKDMKRNKERFYSGAAIYIVIDELAQLTLNNSVLYKGLQIYENLLIIMQQGRAANIHVVAATQSPSRQVIKAPIDVNFSHRVALRCNNPIESRQVLGEPGAEDLPPYGECLISRPQYLGKPKRWQFRITSDEEIQARIDLYNSPEVKHFRLFRH